MIDFTLNPPSGPADSYLDIEFTVEFEHYSNTIVLLFNETSSEHLDILGVDNGYILEGNTAVCKNCSKISGHINLFNNDKMNRKFSVHNSVKIRCEIHQETDNGVRKDSQIIEFYNEAESIDSSVIPFDVTVRNSTIDIDNNIPMVVDVVGGAKKNIELCIKSHDDTVSCSFEVSAKEGKTTVFIPSEYMYHDLELNRTKHKKFKLCYVRYQGISFSRMANRKYISINNDITFNVTSELTSEPQNCFGPTGVKLSDDFMVSDRYLVPCPKKHSGLTGKTSFGSSKLMDLTMLLYESQDLSKVSHEIQQFGVNDSQSKIRETGNILHLSQMKENSVRSSVSLDQFRLLNSVSSSYDKVSFQYSVNNTDRDSGEVSTFSHAYKKQDSGCLPCARKKLLKNVQNS